MKNEGVIHDPSNFRVASHCAVKDRKGNLFLAGSPLTKAALTEADLKEHHRTGHIVRVGVLLNQEAPQEDTPVLDGTNGVTTKSEGERTVEDLLRQDLIAGEDASKGQIDAARNLAAEGVTDRDGPNRMDSLAPEKQVIQAQASTNVTQHQTPWTINPKSLEGRTRDQLNVMIFERDRNQQPFETVEEATAFLTQDYKA